MGVTWTFDPLGRMTTEANALGAFTYLYDGQTNRVASVAYPNGQSSTYTWVTSRMDPLDRQSTYTYAANGIDLLERGRE